MSSDESRVRWYVENRLYRIPELIPYIHHASIIRTADEPGIVWDIMVLLSDESFDKFCSKHGDCFVVDDHDHMPWVFTRIKGLTWLKDDLRARLPIALWIYSNSLTVQVNEESKKILDEAKSTFAGALPDLIRKKYLEFRSERHALRHALSARPEVRTIASALTKSTVTKLAFELNLLADGKPYPYKILLPWVVRNHSKDGEDLYRITEQFMDASDATAIIQRSDELVEKVITILQGTKLFSDDFLHRWWLYLA